MLGKEYVQKAMELVEQAADSQYEQIQKAAGLIFDSLKSGGLLHLFGCGHSNIMVEESFYRAGGLIPVSPIFESSLMLHEGAVKSSQLERMSGYAPIIMDRHPSKEGEVLIIFSNSGINSLPIEMALAAKTKGLKVVAVTSLSYVNEKSRYATGEKLFEVADLVINTQMPHGDALIEFKNTKKRALPGSTVVGTVILNMIIAEVLEKYDDEGLEPPIFISGNIEGGFETNQENINCYSKLVKHL